MIKNMRLGLPPKAQKAGEEKAGGSFCQVGTSRFLVPSFWQVPSEVAGGEVLVANAELQTPWVYGTERKEG